MYNLIVRFFQKNKLLTYLLSYPWLSIGILFTVLNKLFSEDSKKYEKSCTNNHLITVPHPPTFIGIAMNRIFYRYLFQI